MSDLRLPSVSRMSRWPVGETDRMEDLSFKYLGEKLKIGSGPDPWRAERERQNRSSERHRQKQDIGHRVRLWNRGYKFRRDGFRTGLQEGDVLTKEGGFLGKSNSTPVLLANRTPRPGYDDDVDSEGSTDREEREAEKEARRQQPLNSSPYVGQTQSWTWKKKLFSDRLPHQGNVSHRALTLPNQAKQDRLQYVEDMPTTKFGIYYHVPKLSMTKLTWCHVPPLTFRIGERPPTPVCDTAAAPKPKRRRAPPIPIMGYMTLDALKKMFLLDSAGHNFQDVMPAEIQEQFFDNLIKNNGRWYEALRKCHFYYSSKSHPVNGMQSSEVILFFKESKLINKTLTTTYLSSLHLDINNRERNAIMKKTGKVEAADGTLSLKELIVMTVIVATKRFCEECTSIVQCLEKLYEQFVVPLSDSLLTPKMFRAKYKMLNSDFARRLQQIKQNLLELKYGSATATPEPKPLIRDVFAEQRPRLKKLFTFYGGANQDAATGDNSTLDQGELQMFCKDFNLFDSYFTKRGMRLPFAMSMETKDIDDLCLSWKAFVEFVFRVACIKYGNNDLAKVAGREVVAGLHTDSKGSDSIVRCFKLFCEQLASK